MRTSSTRGLLLSVAAIAATGLIGDAACSPTKATEIVPGALTQVNVPGDLAAIKLAVLANGQQKFCGAYQVSNGQVELPSTLGVIGGNSSTTLNVALFGYDQNALQGNDWQNCFALSGVGDGTSGGPRVLRSSTLTFVNQQTLFLPMPLSFSCYDVACGQSQTCKGGQCLDATVPVTSLPAFDPSLVDGTQDCFSPSQCFAASTAAVPIDPTNCIWGLPPGSTQAQGVNVRVAYATNTWLQDLGTGQFEVQPGVPTESEVLNQDPDEGFTIPDPSNPTQIKLAGSPTQGLCGLAVASITPPAAPTSGTKNFGVISEVQIALGCASKSPFLPFCSSEQHGNVAPQGQGSPAIACGVPVGVTPASSAVYVLVDDSASMAKAFGPKGYATVMNLSFADPVFKRTYIAFKFLSHQGAECTQSTATSYLTPAIDWGLAPTVQPQIAPLLLNVPHPSPPDTTDNPAPLDLLAALRADEGAYKHVKDFSSRLSGGTGALNNASVMVFVNRTPVFASSGGPDAGGGSEGGVADAGTGSDGGSTVVQRTSGAECDPTQVQPTGDQAQTVDQALANAAQAGAALGVGTYFVVLDNDDHQPPTTFFQQVQQEANGDGGTGPVSVIDGTNPDPQPVLASFEQNVVSAVTCVYDLPKGFDTTATLSFSVPANLPGINPNPVAVPQVLTQTSSCNAAHKSDGSANGWNIDNGRIVICGSSCTNLQATIEAVTAAALAQVGDAGASADGGTVEVPEVPVSITMPCPDAGSP